MPVSQINVSKSFSDSNSTSVSISATSHSNEDESTGPFESSEEEIELSIKKEGKFDTSLLSINNLEISVKRKLFEDELDPSKLKKLKIDTNKTPISAENSPLLFESTKQRASNNSMYQYPFQQTSYSSPQADKKPENSLTCSPHSAASLPFQPAVQTFNLSPPHERSQWPTQQLQYHAYSQPQGFPTYPRIQPSVQPHQVPSDASNWKVLHILHHNLRKPNAIQFHPSPIQNPPQLAPKVPVRRFEVNSSFKKLVYCLNFSLLLDLELQESCQTIRVRKCGELFDFRCCFQSQKVRNS